jgi:predicted anti-sigma-YlaC factor YlaD
MQLARELTCAEVVELVTEYLEGRLEPAEVERFEEHLVFCDGCENFLEQMRTTIEVTGQLREEDLSPRVQETLLSAFRSWRRQ